MAKTLYPSFNPPFSAGLSISDPHYPKVSITPTHKRFEEQGIDAELQQIAPFRL